MTRQNKIKELVEIHVTGDFRRGKNPEKEGEYWTLPVEIGDQDKLLEMSNFITLPVKDLLFQGKGRTKKEMKLIKEVIVGALFVNAIVNIAEETVDKKPKKKRKKEVK